MGREAQNYPSINPDLAANLSTNEISCETAYGMLSLNRSTRRARSPLHPDSYKPRLLSPSRAIVLATFISRPGEVITTEEIGEALQLDVPEGRLNKGVNYFITILRGELGQPPRPRSHGGRPLQPTLENRMLIQTVYKDGHWPLAKEGFRLTVYENLSVT
jgi:DNA-binding response OmpR family regulator